MTTSRPTEYIEECRAAHKRWIATLDSLTDERAREPSRLSGWSRGHVVTHLARKSDSHVWLFEGALAGEVRQQFPRPNVMEDDVQAGAGRSAAALRTDLIEAFGRIEAAFDNHPDDLWDHQGIVAPGKRTMAEIVFRHLRDAEVHHADLNLGYEVSDWPALYVEGELARRLPALASRADHADLVAWLLGRAEAPVLGPW
jgi:maleylpyruvate isomerase